MLRLNIWEIQENLPPEFTVDEARQLLSRRYRAPLKTLLALERTGELIRLKRGLYSFKRGFEPLAAAASLHGPSYVSFETALSHYGLIPERVETIMSVVDGRPANYNTPVGRFEYRSQTRLLFALGMDLIFIGDRACPVANREKALLDTLARANLRASAAEPGQVLSFVQDSLRIDFEALETLSKSKLRRMAPHYRNLAPRRLVEALSGSSNG